MSTSPKFFLIVISILSLSFTLPAQVDSTNIVFGHYRNIHSDILDQERVLYLHLPDDYHDSKEAYPVVFQLYSHFRYNYYLPAIPG